jgi:hypothetical protein
MIVIGSAKSINILISILRMKVLAILLGPAGIGLLSIYNSLQGLMSTAAGLGMGSSGVRQIASVKGEEQALSRVRRVLLAAHLVQGRWPCWACGYCARLYLIGCSLTILARRCRLGEEESIPLLTQNHSLGAHYGPSAAIVVIAGPRYFKRFTDHLNRLVILICD